MQSQDEDQGPSTTQISRRRGGKWIAAAVLLGLAASLAFPLTVVILGIVLVALVSLDASIPGVVPGLRTLFRVPLVPARERRVRLILAGGLGVVLVVCGTLGAKLSVQLRTEWRLRQSQHRLADQQLEEHLERARAHLAADEVELAELTLMDAQRIPPVDAGRQRELDQLLERIRRSGDRDAILEVLLGLSAHEFDAFVQGESIPPSLEFPERALTYRAVQLARAQLPDARARRARP